MRVLINAGFRLFASGHDEAGTALRAIAKILGSSFVTNEYQQQQAVVWRAPTFKAALVLDRQHDELSFSFRDKLNHGGFDAEGTDAASLLKDIRYNVKEFRPTKNVDPHVEALRTKFENIQ